MSKLPSIETPLIDLDAVREYQNDHWVLQSERGFEVIGYEESFQILGHPALQKGPSFQRRIEELGVGGEARRYFDMALPNAEGEYRQRLRAPLAALFRPTQIAKLRSSIKEMARNAVEAIDSRNPFDLMEQLCWVIPSQTYCELVSIPYEEAPRVRRIGDAILGSLLTGDRSKTTIAEDALLESVDMVREHLDARRNNLGDDFTSVMIRQQLEGKLTEEELFVEAFSILQASVDNTAHQMGNALGAMLTNGHWETFVNDRSLAKNFIEESIRLYPRFRTIFRLASEDVTVQDVVFPKGAWVFVSVGAGQRDPRVFADPNTFDFERQPKRPVMFGAGNYNCLGQNLARMEIEESLSALAERFPRLSLAAPWGRRQTDAVSETAQLLVQA